jgi:hypothetical protein
MTDTMNVRLQPVDGGNSSPHVTTSLGTLAPGSQPTIPDSVVEMARSLPETSRATLIAQYERSFGKEAVAARFGTPAAAVPKVEPTTKIDPKQISPAQAGLDTQQQVEAAINNLRRHNVPEDAIARALNAAVIQKPAGSVAPPATDPLSPPESAESYDLSSAFQNLEGFSDADPTALAPFQSEMKSALHAAGVSRALGASMVSEGIRFANQIAAARQSANPEQTIKTLQAEQQSILRNLSVDYEQTVVDAAKAFARMPATTQAKLKASGFTNSATVLVHLATAQRNFELRNKK